MDLMLELNVEHWSDRRWVEKIIIIFIPSKMDIKVHKRLAESRGKFGKELV